MKPSKKIPKYSGSLQVIFRWLLTGLVIVLGPLTIRAQIASFNFSASPAPVTGWLNMSGDPSVSVITGTAGGLTLSSVATINWSPYEGACAVNGYGAYPGAYFPIGVMSNTWFQYNGAANSLANYNEGVPQLELTGLNPDSTYILRMSASNVTAWAENPNVFTVAGTTVYASQSMNPSENTSNGVTFQGIAPDATGMIRIYVNTTSSTVMCYIDGLQVFSGTAQVGTPAVAITAPTNGTIISEGGNFAIQATATEPGQTITKVEFYADTTKIGEVDTPPYNFTWVDPDPGAYQLTAKATDNVGTINTASVNVDMTSLNYYWSTTGNISNNGDSNFVGNVDSVRLGFRTKDIERVTITATGNVGIGTIAPTAQFHTTGSVRLAGLGNDSTGADPRVVVSDTSGNLSYRSAASVLGPSIGDGLGESSSGKLTLGDTIPGSGPYNFTASRYQYLNGYMYSIGGSVNNPVTNPDFRIYSNGDLTAGTTMDLSINTDWETGMRYYSKPGVLQVGSSDRFDTTQGKIVYGSWPSSGLIITSDDSNTVKGKILNSLFMGDENVVDSSVYLEDCLVGSEAATVFSGAGQMNTTLLGGAGLQIHGHVDNSILNGNSQTISNFTSGSYLFGYANTMQDSTIGSLISGANNQFGGVNQLMAGQYMVNRTPNGTTLGNNNVDFPSLSYIGAQGTAVPGISGYPLLAIANSASNIGSMPSNAFTVLYNGRTQINTTGFSNALTQANVTPKAALEVVSNNSGVLFANMTTVQRNAIATADLQNGLLVYNTDSSLFQFYNGSAWSSVGASVSVAGWDPSGNTGTNPTNNFIGTTDSESLVFRTDNIVHMTILPGGAVGIGTSALPQPDAQLAVNGTLYATKVEAIQTGWPDYVFDKGYSLPSLANLERYIRLNGHLPGVAPASEVTAKGIDLGDNQSALLRKIEELTLYLIEAHKQSDLRQKEIDRLEKQNKSLDDHQREIDQLMEKLKKMAGNTTTAKQ
jgi:hypothetical protein